MKLEEKTEDTTFAEAIRETSTEAFATPQNLPALSSKGNLTAPPTPDGEPAPVWEKNYTNLVQFSDPEITKAAINNITQRCTSIDRIGARVNKKLWWTVADAIVIFYLSKQSTIDAVCSEAGIKPPNKRGNGRRPTRHFVRLITSRGDYNLSDEDRNTNNKEVGRYARYFDKGLEILEANPEKFHDDPVRKLYAEIEAHHGLERFVKGDEEELEAAADKPSSTPSHANSTGANKSSKGATASASAVASVTSQSVADDESENSASSNDGSTVRTSAAEPVANDEMHREWMKRYIPTVNELASLQELSLNPSLHVDYSGPAILYGNYSNGQFSAWSMATDRTQVEEGIWTAARSDKKFAPRLARAMADTMTTRLFPKAYLKSGTALMKQQAAILAGTRFTLMAPDSFILSGAKGSASVVTRCKLKSPAIEGKFAPLRLAADLLDQLAALAHRTDIGQCVADDLLERSSGNENEVSRELLVTWEDDPAEGYYFDPIAPDDDQLDFRFAKFEAVHVATLDSAELQKLHDTVLKPWVSAFSKTQQAKRDHTASVGVSIGRQFVVEFNGGVPHKFAYSVTREADDILRLVFRNADIFPVLWFISSGQSSRVRLETSHEGILFTVAIDYAEFSIFVPAVKPGSTELRDDNFCRFPASN